MKTLKRIILLCCFAPAMTFAQVDKTEHDSRSLENAVSDDGYTVPEEVRSDFEERYPNSEVTNLYTSKERYTVEFEKGDKQYTTFYDTQNNWIKTFEHMKYDELPEQAKRSFMGTPYSDYKVDQVSKVDNGVEEKYYQLSIQDKGTSRNLYLDSEGTIMEDRNEESPSTDNAHPGKPGFDNVGNRNRKINEHNTIGNPTRRPNINNRNNNQPPKYGVDGDELHTESK